MILENVKEKFVALLIMIILIIVFSLVSFTYCCYCLKKGKKPNEQMVFEAMYKLAERVCKKK